MTDKRCNTCGKAIGQNTICAIVTFNDTVFYYCSLDCIYNSDLSDSVKNQTLFYYAKEILKQNQKTNINYNLQHKTINFNKKYFTF